MLLQSFCNYQQKLVTFLSFVLMKSITQLHRSELSSSPPVMFDYKLTQISVQYIPEMDDEIGKKRSSHLHFLNQASWLFGFNMSRWSGRSSVPSHFSHSVSAAEHIVYGEVPSLVLLREDYIIPQYAAAIACRSSCFQSEQASACALGIQGTAPNHPVLRLRSSCKPSCLPQWHGSD